MEGPKGIEFEHEKSVEETDAGFSEKRAARVLEGKHTDNSQVKKRKLILKRAARVDSSKREKILVAHEKNAKQLLTLVKTLGDLSRGAVRQEELLLIEIRARQKIQEQLLNALILDSRGELTEDTLPKELMNLIK